MVSAYSGRTIDHSGPTSRYGGLAGVFGRYGRAAPITEFDAAILCSGERGFGPLTKAFGFILRNLGPSAGSIGCSVALSDAP